MKIDEKMIEQMTEEEQKELIELLEKHRQKQKETIARNFVDKLREMIFEATNNDIVFYVSNDYGGDYKGINLKVIENGNTIAFTFVD